MTAAEKQTTRLIEIMQRLRNPNDGCPWDLQQNLQTIAPYIIEEAYETVEAIETGNAAEICNELGDLLLQVVFCSQLAREQKWFEYADVAKTICEKMIRRHPHVFGNEKAATPEQVKENWDKIKRQEKLDTSGEGTSGEGTSAEDTSADKTSILDGVPIGLAALSVALKLQKKAAKVGFDWQTPQPVLAKITEELAELTTEIDKNKTNGDNKQKMQEELGDLLFTIVNLARQLGIEPEQALRTANRKFKQRFLFIENTLEKNGKNIATASLEDMEALWQQAKQQNKT